MNTETPRKRTRAPQLSDEARQKGYATAEELADLLGLSVQRIRQLRNDGAMITEETPQGMRYHREKSLVALSKYLLAKQDRDTLKDRAAKADADYKEKKAALLDIELRKRKGEVHEARHVEELMNCMILETKAAFLAIPARIALKLALCKGENEMAAVVRKALYDVMASMAQHKYDPERYRQLVEEEGDLTAALNFDTEEEEESE